MVRPGWHRRDARSGLALQSAEARLREEIKVITASSAGIATTSYKKGRDVAADEGVLTAACDGATAGSGAIAARRRSR